MQTLKVLERRSEQHGRLRIDFPEVTVKLPTRQELADIIIRHVEKRLVERLTSVTDRWHGLAKWIAKNLKVEGGAIVYPRNAAVERFGRVGIDPEWIDEALRDVVKRALKAR